VHLITTVSTLADFAFFWSQSPIASLSQFFLKDDFKQKTYQSTYAAMKLMDLSEKSTPLSSSGKASNPNGRMRRIRMEEGLSFRCQNPSPTKNKSTRLSHSS
jgi:hypothetical protein